MGRTQMDFEKVRSQAIQTRTSYPAHVFEGTTENSKAVMLCFDILNGLVSETSAHIMAVKLKKLDTIVNLEKCNWVRFV
jgi:hypothetical protein